MKRDEFFQLPSITRGKAIAGAFEDAAQAIQAKAEQQNDETARVYAEQRPPRVPGREQRYRDTLDRIHAAALAIRDASKEGKR